MNIWYGSNENAWLSNLAERPFSDKNGLVYKSVEHAYQTWKAGAFDSFTYTRPWKEGSKFIGRGKAKTLDNWNIALMQKLLKASFDQNPVAKGALLATKGKTLTHTQDKGIWSTEFPRLLMELRDEYLSH